MLPVVGRVAEADEDLGVPLYLQRPLVLLGELAGDEREAARRRRAGGLQGVGEVDVDAVGWQRAPGIHHALGDPEVGDGVGADE